MTRTPSKPLFVSVILYDLQLLNKVISSLLELREFAKSMIASLSSDVLTVNHLVTIAKVTKVIAKVNMSVAFVQEHMKHGHVIAPLHCVVQTARKLELDLLLSAITMKCDCLVIAGDLNIHFENKNDKLVRKTLYLFLSYGFNHHVNEPTHVAGGSLDQIFCFSIKNQLQCKVLVDSVNRHGSDHFPVYCDFSLEFEKKYFKDITYRNLKTVDDDQFTSDLFDIVNLIDLGKIGTTDMSASVANLNDLCAELLDEHAPIVSKKVSVIDSAPWFDNEYRDYRKLRRKAEAKTRKPTATLEDKIMFRDISSECSKMADLKKKEYFKNMVENSKGNPRTLWQLVNRNLDRKQSNPLPDYTDDLPKLAADFNAYFTSKIDNIRKDMDHDRFTLPSDSSAEAPESYHWSTFEPVTLDELKEIIDEFGIKCSPSDILPTTLLKENISILLPLLLQIVNASLSQGSMDGVKLADIVPLLKKQSAYKKTFSTETLLIRIWNDLLVASDEKSATVVMMLDLSAAFDTVDHDVLLNILMKEIGLRGTVLKWAQFWDLFCLTFISDPSIDLYKEWTSQFMGMQMTTRS
ncbi:uncharacterized protein LOC134826809 [Bolinopsis microptera]|uniref:uncharacterized protein LOC134826809 n=1 Tax=Bolinopsis microptera TaxID=2820187 RepID=UPI0030791D2F